ncbi:MAG: thiamine pyrophosphate-dependent enzyme [Lentimicrobiaceae bacterium]|nr:thiamine pyrophosphate-dependent enzyme [Lentimicrobiaceae bacterium]
MKKEIILNQLSRTDWKSEFKDLRGIDANILSRMLFDIRVISNFEEAILALKNDDCVWGPIHTSIGQEAIAVGTVAALKPSDKFFGTHRSHHQFLSKALQYAVESDWNPAINAVSVEAETVVLRTLAEIMGLSDGFCGGRGGSMHLRWKEAGFFGSNAIVGGGIPLATGAAFSEKFKKTGNIVVAFFGDGAINQGAFHEACNLAGLWKLPVIFFLENNEYAVGTSIKDSCAISDLSIRAASYGMDAHIVQGHDIVAIYELVKDVAKGIREGGKPCMIEAKCYRRYHHSGDQPGSAFKYRSKEEEENFMKMEVVARFPELLLEKKILSKKEIDHISKLAAEVVEKAVDYYTMKGKPRQVKTEYFPSSSSASLGTRSDGTEFQKITFSERNDFYDFEEMRYSDSIAAVTGRWLEKYPDTIVLGEEIANFGGGAYGATKGLSAKYPDRVLNTPISEAGFTGLGLGTAMSGMRTIVEIMFPDFSLVAADQIFNQIGKARHMYGNTTNIPLVLRTRIAIGCGYGGQHSMDPVGLYALFSGWRIVAPANAFDYVGLFNTAMQSNDPVLIIEHNALDIRKFPVPADNLDYFIEFGKARLIEEGKDVTLIAYGYMALRIEQLNPKFIELGISVDMIDLRTIDLPSLDFDTLGRSLKKTGVAVIIEEAPTNLSIGGKIAAELTERFFDYLDSPIMRLSSLDVPNSVSRVLEQSAMLDDETIIQNTILAAKRQWK